MRLWRSIGSGALALLFGIISTGNAAAASSKFCDGGGWTLTQQGQTMQAKGRHVGFDIDLQTGAVLNWTLTGADNPGRLVVAPTVIYLEKTPLHGAILTQTEVLQNNNGDLLLIRTNGDVSVQIQAKDCAQGGVFQMEVARNDGATTRFRHVLGPDVFYFDNPNFRDREGDVVPFSNSSGFTTNITITPRINFGSDASDLLVGRDSPQVATRVQQAACTNSIPRRPDKFTTPDTVRHCGGVTEWDVASGGRMGQVMGGDSTEVAPPATNCTQNCQAQNRVRGGAVNLGFPVFVPDAFRLKPRTP